MVNYGGFRLLARPSTCLRGKGLSKAPLMVFIRFIVVSVYFGESDHSGAEGGAAASEGHREYLADVSS